MMETMTCETFTAGDYRVRMVWDDTPRDPLGDGDHGVTVIPLELPSGTREDYYTSNDDTPEADLMRELLGRMDNVPLDFATPEERSADHEDFTTGGGIKDMKDVAEVFYRLTGRSLTVRPLRGASQSDWAVVAAWAVEDGESIGLVGGVLDVLETHMRGEVYGLIVERRDTFANVDDEDDTMDVWREVESCWGYEGSDYAVSEARSILKHYAPGAVIAVG